MQTVVIASLMVVVVQGQGWGLVGGVVYAAGY